MALTFSNLRLAFFRSVLIVVLLTSVAGGQLKDRDLVLGNLSDETAAVIQIYDPTNVFQYLEGLVEPDELTAQWLQKWLIEPTVGIATESELKEALEWKQQLFRALQNANQVTLVFHVLNRDQIEFSLVLQQSNSPVVAWDELIPKLTTQLDTIQRVLKRPLFSVEQGPWFADANPNPFLPSKTEAGLSTSDSKPEQMKGGPADRKTGSPFSILKLDELLVVTTSKEYWNGSQKPLVESRRFQRIWKEIPTQAQMAFYACPEYIDFQILGFSPESIDNWGTKEITSVGGSMVVSNSVEGHPKVLVNCAAKFTLPRTGLSRYWGTSREIEQIPSICFPFFEFKFQQYDPVARFKMLEETQRDANPDAPATTSDDRLNTELTYNGEGSIRYLAAYQGRPTLTDDLLFVQKVENIDLATKLLRTQVENQNKHGSAPSKLVQRIEEDDDNQDRLTFSETEQGAAFKANEASEFYRTNGTAKTASERPKTAVISGVRTEALSLDSRSNWMATGELKAIDSFLNNASEIVDFDYSDSIRSKIDLIGKLGKTERPFAIEVLSPRSWTVAAGWWSDRWSFDHKNKVIGNPSGSKEQTLAMAQTAFGASLFNRLGSQLVLYSQTEEEMSVTIAIFDSPSILFGEIGKIPEFSLVLDFISNEN